MQPARQFANLKSTIDVQGGFAFFPPIIHIYVYQSLINTSFLQDRNYHMWLLTLQSNKK